MSKRAAAAATPLLIEDKNLSHAWARTIARIQSTPGKNIAPLILSVDGFDDAGEPIEDPQTRAGLDAILAEHEEQAISRVAFTIFPKQVWKTAGGDRKVFFEHYRQAFPQYQAMNRKLNGRGLYFERLMMFGEGPMEGNQLEYIIDQYNGRTGVRDSMLQASIFDPKRDHTSSAQLGFPCLQHVSFVPTRDGLVTNAFYATQQLFEKAYGNYLGIAQLGSFVAQQIGEKPARLNVFVGVAKLEGIPKTDARLVALIEDTLNRKNAA